MVPHVAGRGSSFKGAGLYYLHDKQADTSERVEWTRTHNIPTDDPEKAMRWMAYTAMNAERIKAENGTSRVGAKAQGKPVYTYSLSWHKEDRPGREEMERAAFESLDKLGLKDHEVVIVAHRDREHPHIHVICNLVDPNTGKTQSMSLDFNELSTWAEKHDREHGREHCPERVKNNAERNQGDLKKQFVKHRAKEDPKALVIRDLYASSDSGKAFRAALEEEGYTLARGHKGRLVMVADDGNITNLSRQLEGQRARDIKDRLKDLDFKSLPVAKDVAFERQSFDREKYHAEWEEKIFQAGIDHEREQREKAARAGEKKKEERSQQEEKERRRLRELAAEMRQERRHERARKHRKPLEEGGSMGAEFNAEVGDRGVKEHNSRIEYILWKEKIGEKPKFIFNQNRHVMADKSKTSSKFNTKVQTGSKTKPDQGKGEEGKSKRSRVKRHREARKHREQHGAHKSVTTREFNEEAKSETKSWSRSSEQQKDSGSTSKRSRVRDRRKVQFNDKTASGKQPQKATRPKTKKKDKGIEPEI